MDESLHMSVPMGFEAEALEAYKAAGREDGFQYYAELKERMLARTRRFGSLLAGYLLLQVSGPVSLLTLCSILQGPTCARICNNIAAPSVMPVAVETEKL